MFLEIIDGYSTEEVLENLALHTARWECMKRMEAGLEPNTLVGSYGSEVALKEALEKEWDKKEYFATLVAGLEGRFKGYKK